MSDEKPAYSQVYVTSWTILSIVLGLGFFTAFVLCNHLLNAGGHVWALIRWLASPFI